MLSLLLNVNRFSKVNSFMCRSFREANLSEDRLYEMYALTVIALTLIATPLLKIEEKIPYLY